jgi:hypothetical protein
MFAGATLAWFALTGRDSHVTQDTGFTIISIASGVAFAAIAGYIAAFLAASRPRYEGSVLAVVIAAFAIVSLTQREPTATSWSQIATIALMAPAALLRARVRARQMRGAAAKG